MKFPRVSVAFAAAGLSLLVGCSTSEFGGGNKAKGPSSGDSQAAEETPKKDDQSADQDVEKKDGEENAAKDDSKLDQKEEMSASSYEADDTTKGCQLPADVRAKFNERAGQKLGFALGWGDTGSSDGEDKLKLSNVTMQDCSWFPAFKESDAFYVVQFDERSKGAGLKSEVVQSYIEPFNGKTPIEFAQCLQAAAMAGATCHRVGDL